MLSFSFFISIFSTFSWLIFCYNFISEKLTGITVASLGVHDLMIYILMTLLPILIIWLIFGYITSFHNARSTHKNFHVLFSQMKKNQDYSDLIARALIECEQDIRSGFILNKFDIFIVDLNELISEIISRCKIISETELQDAWARTENGGKWFLGKILIEAHRKKADFSAEIIRHTENDPLIGGTILEFCARYQSLVGILEKHDKERLLLKIVEMGVLGKVFSILAPIAEKIKNKRDYNKGPFFSSESNEENSSNAYLEEAPKKKTGFFSKVFKKNEEEQPKLERNEPVVEHSFSNDFGDEDVSFKDDEFVLDETDEENEIDLDLPSDEEAEKEIDLEIDSNEAPLINEDDETEEPILRTPSVTEKAMADLKKEWKYFEDLEKSSPIEETKKEPKLSNLTTSEKSFGNWADEENYKK
ncbi:MAG: hypothetical protein PHE89_01325 [Alphaproteobacteria bacterium]|nr:hypothetical protein [Alphaproteobacteria bacterium]